MTSEITSKKISIVTPFGYYFVKDDAETEKDKVKAKNQSLLLSKVDEKFIGFKSISKNLVLSLLAIIIFSPRSQVIRSIDSHLKESEIEIGFFQQKFKSVSDASEEISKVVNLAILTLFKLFELHEYKEYEHSREMHAGAEMAHRYRVFKSKMSNLKHDKEEDQFLVAEIDLLVSRNWPLPATFVSITIGEALVEEQFRHASGIIDSFVENIVYYIETVVVRVLLDHSKEHKQLHPLLKQVGRLSVQDLQENFEKKLKGLLELEKKFIYTSNELFEVELDKAMDVKLNLQVEKTSIGKKFLSIPLLGGKMVRVDHLDDYPPTVVQKAFELKKLMTIYWDFIVERVVDSIALNLQASIGEMLGVGIKGMMHEQLKVFGELPIEEPSVSFNKLTLTNSISDLKKAKEDLKKWQYEIQSLV